MAEHELDPNMAYFTQRILQIEEGFYLETPADLWNLPIVSITPANRMSALPGRSGWSPCVISKQEKNSTSIMPCAMARTYDEFDCYCGSENCRGRVKGTDWMRPELWEKYDGYFMPYLARRIEKLKAKMHMPA